MEDEFAALYLENQLCFPLYAASRLTTKIYAPYLKELGITYPQYLVMLVLWQYKNQTVNTIGQRLFLESNTLTPLLKRLEQKALIRRNRSATDERTVMISLTSTGQKLREEALTIPHKIAESFQDNMHSEAELRNFQQTLFDLISVLQEKTTSGAETV